MNCFRYLKLISPLNAAICTTTYLERQKCYGPGKKILFKKRIGIQGHFLIDLKVLATIHIYIVMFKFPTILILKITDQSTHSLQSLPENEGQ
jgi:hypothetical protein